MKNNIIILILVITAAVVGFILWNGKSSRPAETVNLITGLTSANLNEAIPVYDFGSVSMFKGNVEHDFAVKNTTDSELLVTGAETSCMCTRAVLKLPDGREMGPFGMPGHGFNPSLNVNIKPGESLVVRAIFDPAAHGPAGVGLVERQILLSTNKGQLMMQFRAQVTP